MAVNKQVIHLSKIEMVRDGARGKEEMEKEREREREKAGFRFGPPLRHSARYPALPSLPATEVGVVGAVLNGIHIGALRSFVDGFSHEFDN